MNLQLQYIQLKFSTFLLLGIFDKYNARQNKILQFLTIYELTEFHVINNIVAMIL